MDLDTAIDKFQTILENGHPSPAQLKKYQKILDAIADTYATSHSKKQLSELYTIQAEIYELSGEYALAKDARFRARDVKKNHKRTRKILIFVLTALLAIGIGVIIYALVQNQNEQNNRRADCLKEVKSNAETYATTEADKSEFKKDSTEYSRLWKSYYDTNYREHSSECYN